MDAVSSSMSEALANCLDDVRGINNAPRFSGKVRENFVFPNGRMAIVVTDRVSVFDFKIGTIPYKGQVLNQLSAWWFAKLDRIGIPHHLVDVPHPNVSVVQRVTPLPIEIIVRAYLTGTTTTSSWYAYQHHDRMICGFQMPPGMKKNDPFPQAICTPTTKAIEGHDRNISESEIMELKLVSKTILEDTKRYAFDMFAHGQDVAKRRGLILVDTKYEMGLTEDGRLIVIDEVHTPDSSRYWIADSYEERMAAGEEPVSLDKEFVRRMVIEAGYDVDSDDDPARFLTDQTRIVASRKYIELYAKMTGDAPETRAVREDEVLDVLNQIASTC